VLTSRLESGGGELMMDAALRMLNKLKKDIS
jgi:hypothetical protein